MAIFLAFKGTRKCPELYFTVDQILGGGSHQKMYIKKPTHLINRQISFNL